MNTISGSRNLLKAGMVVLGFALFAYSTVGDYVNFPTLGEQYRGYGVVIASLIFVFAILWHFMDLQTALSDRNPNIEICGEVNPHDVNMGHFLKEGDKTVFVLNAISHMANVPFSNKPKYPTAYNSVDRVRAEITYLDENKKPLFPPIQGRWGDTYQPSQISQGESRKIESIDFPNTGAIRWLDLLIKYPEDNFCFGYNNESYQHPYFLNPDFCIPRSKFFIQVMLIGSYVPNRTSLFEVFTTGTGNAFQIRNLDSGGLEACSKSCYQDSSNY